jgi:aspartate ammonia-lyase
VQFHQSLRIELTEKINKLLINLNEKKNKFHKRYKEMTPAMKIGLTNNQLS